MERNAALGLSPIQRQTVASLVVERLRARILRGDYREGAPLRQEAISAELGVSRIPVREALVQLEAEGLVTISPHVGAEVSSLSLSEIEEVFGLRALIEADLLRRAMPLPAEDLARAEATLDAFEEALASGDTAAWGTLNRDFHAALLRPAMKPVTAGILQTLLNQSDRYTRLQLSLTHGASRAAEEHRAIFRAVRGGDAAPACALLASHILEAGRSLLEFLRAQRNGVAQPSDP